MSLASESRFSAHECSGRIDVTPTSPSSGRGCSGLVKGSGESFGRVRRMGAPHLALSCTPNRWIRGGAVYPSCSQLFARLGTPVGTFDIPLTLGFRAFFVSVPTCNP